MAKTRFLEDVARENLRADIPAFAPGDTVRVMVRVREGEKERLQAFEGICIARRGGGINETFTVRKIHRRRADQLHAPLIAEIGILRKGRVRRAAPTSCVGWPKPASARHGPGEGGGEIAVPSTGEAEQSQTGGTAARRQTRGGVMSKATESVES
jgi:large subunit ribosomal protein L19